MIGIPDEGEISQLPKWARVAFAARCARRVFPLCVAAQSRECEYRIDQAINLAESIAASGSIDHDEAYATRHAQANVNNWIRSASGRFLAALKSAYAAIATTRSPHHDRSRHVSLAYDAARCASEALQNIEGGKPSSDCAPIAADFKELIHRACEKGWTDDTGVSQDVFGPMWPEILDAGSPPKMLFDVVKTISAELISYLKSHPDELLRIRPRQFEELVAEILASYGWEVHLTPATRDGGYDLFAVTKDASGTQNSWIIECKKWNGSVGVDVVRKLYGIRNTMQVGGAMVAATSDFSKDAYTYRDTKTSLYDLVLKDRKGILAWINEYRPNPTGSLYMKDHKLMIPGRG